MVFEDGEAVVFDDLGQRTHMLDAISAAIYVSLRDGRDDMAGLEAAVRALVGECLEGDSRTRVELTLQEFRELGLLGGFSK